MELTENTRTRPLKDYIIPINSNLCLERNKVCLRDEMCAFYHKPEEKQKVEQESIDFYDPFLEEYDDEEPEEEYQSEEKSDNSNNSNNKKDLVENEKSTKLDSKVSVSSTNNTVSEEVPKKNAWASEEFVLEDALKKTHSQVHKKESFDSIEAEEKPNPNKSLKTDNNTNTPLSAVDMSENELSRNEELVSTEIYNIALGNTQQIETSKIVENITSKAPLNSKSKFFNLADDDEAGNNDADDVINDIFSSDFSKVLLSHEDKDKKKYPISYKNHTYRERNELPVVQEEGYLLDYHTNSNSLNDLFDFDNLNHRSAYSFVDRNNVNHFDIYNDNN